MTLPEADRQLSETYPASIHGKVNGWSMELRRETGKDVGIVANFNYGNQNARLLVAADLPIMSLAEQDKMISDGDGLLAVENYVRATCAEVRETGCVAKLRPMGPQLAHVAESVVASEPNLTCVRTAGKKANQFRLTLHRTE